MTDLTMDHSALHSDTKGSFHAWTEDINVLTGSEPTTRASGRKHRRTPQAGLLTTEPGAHHFGYRMAPDVAERLVDTGIAPDYLGQFATLSGLDLRDVLEFAGIDRTTVSRRKASGAALPQDAAVKALQVTDLMTQATEVFGTPPLAAQWLSKPHPLLDRQTPLQRARTPWGLAKVQGLLVALRYGGAA
jgi:putative toxin-antitoxin system antitoxin component (TIGR02293 family)